MKLLVDMNLSPHWAPFLEQRGFAAVHWSDLGAANAPDASSMALAFEKSSRLDHVEDFRPTKGNDFYVGTHKRGCCVL
jgi:predicted nuclease of predicted toxin-antitoxin system